MALWTWLSGTIPKNGFNKNESNLKNDDDIQKNTYSELFALQRDFDLKQFYISIHLQPIISVYDVYISLHPHRF